MEQETRSKEVLQAEESLRQAKARLAKAKRREREKTRKEQDHHKYMMGGVVAKYFPECFGFTEQELNRILACAFKNRDILNMITVVVNERENEEPETAHDNEEEGTDESGETE